MGYEKRIFPFKIFKRLKHMLFYSIRHSIKRFLVSTFNYYKVLFYTRRLKPGNKIVFVDVTEIAWNRYLYSFLKFFHIEGYTVYLPRNKKLINHLCKSKGEFRFSSWILKDNFVKFGKPQNESQIFSIRKSQLSNNYFQSFVWQDFKNAEYHLPMSQFPLVYHRFERNLKFQKDKKRRRSFFMAGNLNEDLYSRIERTGHFDIPSRVTVSNFLKKKKYFQSLNHFEEFERFIDSGTDNKVIIIDTSKEFSIGLDKLKGILTEFDFYLALPGIIIPQCHNIIEALSAGCIPVLHSCYAKLLIPNLEHGKNALIYNELEGLDDLILNSFRLTEQEVFELRLNCIKYYNEILTPEAVVNNIKKNDFSKIYIQAENFSLKSIKTPIS